MVQSQPTGTIDSADHWLIAELLKYADREGSVYSVYAEDSHPLFIPKDVAAAEAAHGPTRADDLFFWKGQLCLAIRGTGRIYQFNPSDGEMQAVRLDKTYFTGYNYGAKVFSVRDTVFSLGGYGYWQFNGQLRFFQSSDLGWDVKTVNQKIPATDLSTYFDRPDGFIYFLGLYDYEVDESIAYSKKKNGYSTLWKLSISAGHWQKLGQLNPEFSRLYRGLQALKVAETPFGELVAFPIGAQNPNGLLINYRVNRVFTLKSPEKGAMIYSPFVANKNVNPRADRFVSFYTVADSTLHIIRTDMTHKRVIIKQADIKEFPLRIHDKNTDAASNKSEVSIGELWPLIGCLTLLIGSAMIYKATRIKQISKELSGAVPINDTLFTAIEMHVINNLINSSDSAVGTDGLDEWLGNLNKSIDLRNKYRSVFIRNLNQKYALMTNDKSGLIHAERLDSDRRMVRYRFDREKFNKLMAGSGRSGN